MIHRWLLHCKLFGAPLGPYANTKLAKVPNKRLQEEKKQKVKQIVQMMSHEWTDVSISIILHMLFVWTCLQSRCTCLQHTQRFSVLLPFSGVMGGIMPECSMRVVLCVGRVQRPAMRFLSTACSSLKGFLPSLWRTESFRFSQPGSTLDAVFSALECFELQGPSPTYQDTGPAYRVFLSQDCFNMWTFQDTSWPWVAIGKTQECPSPAKGTVKRCWGHLCQEHVRQWLQKNSYMKMRKCKVWICVIMKSHTLIIDST